MPDPIHPSQWQDLADALDELDELDVDAHESKELVACLLRVVAAARACLEAHDEAAP
jgi:hypothetical protein